MPAKEKTSPHRTSLWQILAGVSGFSALVLGAIGAHAVANKHAAELIEKASLYQLIHTAVILLMAVSDRYLRFARLLFLAGIILFCGSIYLKALLGWHEIARVAPLGGMAFMLGWLLIAWGGMRRS